MRAFELDDPPVFSILNEDVASDAANVGGPDHGNGAFKWVQEARHDALLSRRDKCACPVFDEPRRPYESDWARQGREMLFENAGGGNVALPIWAMSADRGEIY